MKAGRILGDIKKFKLIVDSREKDAEVNSIRELGIPFSIEALTTGDYKIICEDGDVTMERKETTDFITSLMSGRLEEQASRMSKEKIPILLITGSWKEYKRYAKSNKFTEDHVYGAIASLVTRFGFRSVIWIQSTDDHPHTAGLKIGAKILKKISEGKLDAIPSRSIGRVENPQREVVKLLLHVPDNVAENLLKKFGTLRLLLNATDAEMLTVDGMGPTRLQRVRNMLDTIHTNAGQMQTMCDQCKSQMHIFKDGNVWKAVCRNHNPPLFKELTNIDWPKK